MTVKIYNEIYEFAASAGALEGYVFLKKDLQADHLDNWIRNLENQYRLLPEEVRQCVQTSVDRTLGRAWQSIAAVLGETHRHVRSLKSMTAGNPPDSPQDFEKEKKEKAEKYCTG
ncbi:hypothetical protein [Desulfosarcina ovata]|uniref:Uncharacterized protein n=2 Tax=Desulfosarcina ovata TaxID=83564 RepID=A0A5K8AG61_9BACT|nr:hypothetical protein [Desulfosarcina ovata]BBO84351.1 hypothetical protein DSCO28_49170 [Desulfosarcina ovata subsp. sediminis]BBO90864.1 hypothetical protein DSCOOX_40440 [Desulfosarcina ovata subsp. ovata]